MEVGGGYRGLRGPRVLPSCLSAPYPTGLYSLALSPVPHCLWILPLDAARKIARNRVPQRGLLASGTVGTPMSPSSRARADTDCWSALGASGAPGAQRAGCTHRSLE